MLAMGKHWMQVTVLAMSLFPIILATGSNLYSRKTTQGAQISLERVLSEHKVESRIQCLHRCKRNPECIDVAMADSNVCLLLGNDTQASVKDKQVINDPYVQRTNGTVDGLITELITQIKFDSGMTYIFSWLTLIFLEPLYART